MAYLIGTGDGEDPTAIIFNSTKYPGVCKPSDKYTYEVFKELQRQLNRLAQSKGVAKIGVDGDIGPGTVNLARTLSIDASGACTVVAQNAAVYASVAKGLADRVGVPTTVASPITIKPSTIVNAVTGAETIVPSGGIAGGVMDAWNNLSPIAKVAGIGIAGGIGYMLWKKAR